MSYEKITQPNELRELIRKQPNLTIWGHDYYNGKRPVEYVVTYPHAGMPLGMNTIQIKVNALNALLLTGEVRYKMCDHHCYPRHEYVAAKAGEA